MDDDDLDPATTQEQEADGNTEAQSEEQEALDAELEEAQFRINLGQYYAVLVKKGGIFKDGSRAAKTVDDEVSAFARERMATLLNLTSAPKPKVELPFTQEQIQVLVAIANRYMEKQQAIPTVKPPETATPKPAPIAVPTIPTIQSLAPPTSVKPEASKPAAPTAAKKPKKPRLSTKEPVEGMVVEHEGEYQRYVNDGGQLVIYPFPDGEVFEFAGKHWKYVTNPETKKRLKMSVSLKKQVGVGHQRLPMPDMQQYSEIQARTQVNNLSVNESDKRNTGQ